MTGLLNQPWTLWVAVAVIAAGTVRGFGTLRAAYGLPLLGALATTLFWYVGDVVYNDDKGMYGGLFAEETQAVAWLEVALFAAVLALATPPLHRRFNSQLLNRSSRLFDLVDGGAGHPGLQKMLPTFLRLCGTIWLILIVFAVIRLGADVVHFVLPVFGRSLTPFGRARVGGGFSALMSLGQYLHMLVATGFGLVWTLSTRRGDRAAALVGMVTTWPFFIFSRTRHTMIMVCLPAVLAYVFIRMRGSYWKKGLILLVLAVGVDAWFRLVMEARGAGRSVFRQAFDVAEEQPTEDDNEQHRARHGGLNMYEELCWINKFIEEGSYRVNWGRRYFADLVNPIPRGLWPGKPSIGLDYAIARGQGQGQKASEAAGGVYATISTGMIGQGVVNFGRLLGPMAAAMIMSGWLVFLARLDLQGELAGRLPLYGLGLVSIFNMGRDISLLLLYPMLFGYLFVRLFYDRRRRT